MRVLVVGPSSTRSKGGMATVIKEIENDEHLRLFYDLDSFESYIDGGKINRLLFSVYSYLKFTLTKKNYDIYHIHAASRGSTFRKGYYVQKAKKWGKKVILHIHGAQYMEFYNECNAKKKEKLISILKDADLVIALSKEWKNKFDETFGLTNCVVLENGINTEVLRPAITPSEVHQKSFVTLGRLGQRKGTYDLIDAVDIAKTVVPEIKVYLAGDGEVDQIKALVSKRNLQKNIEVVGWINSDGKRELLKRVSTVILASYNEGLPMSILEGMACGKAIISTMVGAIPEVVSRNNGILIEAGDVQALANAIIKCALDKNIMNDMAQNNIAKIKNNFSMTIMHEKLANYYHEVLD